MGASKRLRNAAGVRGTPAESEGGNGPRQQKRGLKGDAAAGGRFTGGAALNPHDARSAVTPLTGVTDVNTGDAGLGGGTNTVVGRGSSIAVQAGDARSVLDSDLNPLGTDPENAALATFTVATGTGAAGTFEATGENTGATMQVSVYERDTDTDADGNLIGVFYVAADGTAKTITVGSAYAGVTVAVYVREMDADGKSAGVAFGTRRTVAVHA